METKTSKKNLHVCPHCNKSFPQKWKLTRHLNRKFSCIIRKCDKCGKEFKRACNFKRHLERKFTCLPLIQENYAYFIKNSNENTNEDLNKDTSNLHP